MSSDHQDKFYQLYQDGKVALEKGKYRQSIQYFEEAQNFIPLSSKIGGELQIWLITAYQALNQTQEAISLCQQLTTHPHTEIRKQAKRLLFIIQAPKLNRPQEWMSEIPDLAQMSESNPQDRYAATTNTNYSSTKKESKSKLHEPLDLFQPDNQDNSLFWFVLMSIMLTIGSLIWLRQI